MKERERLSVYGGVTMMGHDRKFTFNQFGVSVATETKIRKNRSQCRLTMDTNAGAAVAKMNIEPFARHTVACEPYEYAPNE